MTLASRSFPRSSLVKYLRLCKGRDKASVRTNSRSACQQGILKRNLHPTILASTLLYITKFSPYRIIRYWMTLHSITLFRKFRFSNQSTETREAPLSCKLLLCNVQITSRKFINRRCIKFWVCSIVQEHFNRRK